MYDIRIPRARVQKRVKLFELHIFYYEGENKLANTIEINLRAHLPIYYNILYCCKTNVSELLSARR